MEYLRKKSGLGIGKRNSFWDPIDEYFGEKGGKELWLKGDSESQGQFDRIHYWLGIQNDGQVEDLKEEIKEVLKKRFGVPYHKVLYDEGKLSEE